MISPVTRLSSSFSSVSTVYSFACQKRSKGCKWICILCAQFFPPSCEDRHEMKGKSEKNSFSSLPEPKWSCCYSVGQWENERNLRRFSFGYWPAACKLTMKRVSKIDLRVDITVRKIFSWRSRETRGADFGFYLNLSVTCRLSNKKKRVGAEKVIWQAQRISLNAFSGQNNNKFTEPIHKYTQTSFILFIAFCFRFSSMPSSLLNVWPTTDIQEHQKSRHYITRHVYRPCVQM